MYENICHNILIISIIILILLVISLFLPCIKRKFSKKDKEFEVLEKWYENQKSIVKNGGTYTVTISCSGKKDFSKALFDSNFTAENNADNTASNTQTQPTKK